MSTPDFVLLLHASDFHVKSDEGEPLKRAHDARSLFAFDAVSMAKIIGTPTALVLSGDIAFSGGAVQYDVAREMLNGLLSQLGLSEKRVLVVPGNHDVDRPETEHLKARMTRDSLRALDDKQAEEVFIREREELLAPLHGFLQFSMAYDCLIPGKTGYWEIDNQDDSTASEYLAASFPISIRGISTAHASDRNDDHMNLENPPDDGSHMYVARGQLTCAPLETGCPFKLFIGHHPPNWWRFSEDREDLLRARYHLHLFGHEHRFAPRVVGNAIRIGAGAINPEEFEDDVARYNWVKISKNDDGFHVRIWSRTYDTRLNKFVEDPEWPSGKGFVVSETLSSSPRELGPEQIDESDTATPDLLQKPAIAEFVEADKKAEQEVKEVSPRSAPSAHTVRYYLFSQHPLAYARVFAHLGFVPTEGDMLELGGLEFYESALDKIIADGKIEDLLEAMKQEGISVG